MRYWWYRNGRLVQLCIGVFFLVLAAELAVKWS